MKKTTLSKVTTVLAKIIEVISFAGVGITVSALISLAILLATGHLNQQMFNDVFTNAQINTAGSQAFIKDGQFYFPGFFLYFGIIAIQAFFAGLIFHNIGKIFALDAGSPFSAENVKRIRNIGIFALALPIVKIVLPLLGLIFGANALMGVSAYEFLFALVALSLSQYFAYGAELEKDVDGLL
ncbi:hypothetical protein D6856_03105 [Butyrivibrio sp. XB500-5]|uniref:hypothetical protein n=1 Tax=Butyrivibrio sp. XB500-5 TaxID=2364880 RepID=UPI000EA85B2A|nr:hypothetical protein [Butyrivibrio sp. XB500-5]RKM63126.1 hypothetical protein D6856_03105 [Butyrivibrio sp. XB500-5]